MNYIDITKIDLFPVVQNYPPVRFSLHARLQASLRSTCTKKSRIPTECSRYHCGEGGIRTPGAFQLNSFQDCRNRPLYHLSCDSNKTNQTLSEHAVPKLECKGNIIFSNSKNTSPGRADNPSSCRLRVTSTARRPTIRNVTVIIGPPILTNTALRCPLT